MRFVAYSGPDDYVESSDNLDHLLRVLRHLVDPAFPEDIAVWEGEAKLVAVVLADGEVIRFDKPSPCPSILPYRRFRR